MAKKKAISLVLTHFTFSKKKTERTSADDLRLQLDDMGEATWDTSRSQGLKGKASTFLNGILCDVLEFYYLLRVFFITY